MSDVERKFADLNLVLQRAVQDATLEGHEHTTEKGYYGFFVPHDVWEEVTKALAEIDKYAREIAFGRQEG